MTWCWLPSYVAVAGYLDTSFFQVAFSVLTNVTVHHFPVCQCTYCFANPCSLSSLLCKCYFVQWLTVLSIAQLMMSLQSDVMFHVVGCSFPYMVLVNYWSQGFCVLIVKFLVVDLVC